MNTCSCCKKSSSRPGHSVTLVESFVPVNLWYCSPACYLKDFPEMRDDHRVQDWAALSLRA